MNFIGQAETQKTQSLLNSHRRTQTYTDFSFCGLRRRKDVIASRYKNKKHLDVNSDKMLLFKLPKNTH